MIDIAAINKDKHLFVDASLPLITVYDDYYYFSNDYDVLSHGQRNYLINYFTKQGFVQTSGRVLTLDGWRLEFIKPNRLLAQSSFQPAFIDKESDRCYLITPTGYAQAIFYQHQVSSADTAISEKAFNLFKALIDKCPFNLQWLKDVHINTDLAPIINANFNLLNDYQAQVIEEKFKNKRPL
ncbi:hypothetical protein HR060_01540 [Catenovulum sp. SM1970]|uniref:hypothetical protein n=1 Tax=Marinifaba aquimaris TaxID=2741323 RepID=UPI0015736DC8|nr:hypothetical protein [Marinifaba aquimaris]NTS75536.1 hypothetical protein [Marinifaba aquimaris]